jgi:hypothetical protein
MQSVVRVRDLEDEQSRMVDETLPPCAQPPRLDEPQPARLEERAPAVGRPEAERDVHGAAVAARVEAPVEKVQPETIEPVAKD